MKDLLTSIHIYRLKQGGYLAEVERPGKEIESIYADKFPTLWERAKRAIKQLLAVRP